MKRYLSIITFLLLFASTGYGQVFVNHSSWLVESRLKYAFKKHKTIVTQTDTSLTYLLRDTLTRPLDIYCSFDKSKNCIFQKMSFDCDTCYHKFLKGELAEKKYEWQSIGGSRYLSKYSKHLLLVGDDKKLYYTLSLFNYTEDEYKKILGTK